MASTWASLACMVEVSVPCGACGKPIRGGDEYCEACGAPVTPLLKAAFRERLEASHEYYAGHAKQVRSAQNTIGVLSGLFVVGALISFLMNHDAPNGEAWQILGVNLFLALVMLGLWLWSKRSLLPAIIAALAIYVTVILGSALVDPKTIIQGIIVKFLVIGALIKGVQSALAARRFELAR